MQPILKNKAAAVFKQYIDEILHSREF